MTHKIELFECSRHPGGLRLTKNACAAGWLRAKKEREGCCFGCPIGGELNGVKVEPAKPTVMFECLRCGKSAKRMVYGRLCVSCCNRQYEILRGKNAKGSVPVKMRLVVVRLAGLRPLIVSSITEYLRIAITAQPETRVEWPPMEKRAVDPLDPGSAHPAYTPSQFERRLST